MALNVKLKQINTHPPETICMNNAQHLQLVNGTAQTNVMKV